MPQEGDVSSNTVTGSEEGVMLADSSITNNIAYNVIAGNEVAIESDPTSHLSVLAHNRLFVTRPAYALCRIAWCSAMHSLEQNSELQPSWLHGTGSEWLNFLLQ